MNDVLTAVSTVGFPIVACIGIGYLYNRTITEVTTAVNDLTVALGNVQTVCNHILSTVENEDE